MPLVNSAEVQMRRVVQEALKFARHSKRQRLVPADINKALQLVGESPVYGPPSSRDPLLVPLAEAVATSGHNPKSVETALVDLSKGAKQRISLEDLKEADLPRVPLVPGLSASWIAVRGAPPMQKNKKRKRSVFGSNVSSASNALGPSIIQPGLIHALSREQQQLLTDLLDHATGANHVEQQRAFQTLRTAVGMQPLVPYIVRHITMEVNQNLRNLPVLDAMMRLSESLLLNTTINLELYLDQMMPSIFSCLVGKRIGNLPSENHWGLRDLAASLIARVCTKFGTKYPNLQPRILNTMCRALWADKAKSLTTQYGAIVGLTLMGPLVVEQLILPKATQFLSRLDAEEAAINRADEGERISRENRRTAKGSSTASYHGIDFPTDTKSNQLGNETRKATKRANRKVEIEKCRSAICGSIGCYARSNKLASSAPSIASAQVVRLVSEKYKLEEHTKSLTSSISLLLEQAGDPLLPFIQAKDGSIGNAFV